ncbi:hypothetical protein FQZ97_1033130 [compost metagenome]
MAAPSGRPNTHTPNAATRPTVSAMETLASNSGARHCRKLNGTGIFTPAENSEISTATSVSTSSTADCFSGLKLKAPSTVGPMIRPTAR